MSPSKIDLEYFTHFLKELKKYIKSNPQRLKDYEKTVETFLSNPTRPGLNIEKLENTRGVYTIRLNKSDRIFFIWKEKNTAIFIDIGKHDIYRKY